jgi:ribosomal protein S18 acetylase RimI-like enzyme
VTVGDARREDITAAIDVLAAAYADDPVMVWLEPDPHDRMPLLHDYFTLHVGRAVAHGALRIAYHGRQVAGVAIVWANPLPDGLLGLGPLGEMALTVAGDQLARIDKVLHRRRPIHHRFLACIAVAPAWSEHGIDNTLLSEHLRQNDVPLYTEVTDDRARVFFCRHGFQPRREPVSVDGSPPIQALEWVPPFPSPGVRRWRSPQR